MACSVSSVSLGYLWLQFLTVPAFRNVTLKCLTEIGKEGWMYFHGGSGEVVMFLVDAASSWYSVQFTVLGAAVGHVLTGHDTA